MSSPGIFALQGGEEVNPFFEEHSHVRERMAEKVAAALAEGAALVREEDLPDAPSPPAGVERWHLVPQASGMDPFAPPQPDRPNT